MIRRAEGPQADAARRMLDDAAADFQRLAEEYEQARLRLASAIITVLRDRTLGPSEVAGHVPYDRQHIGRIAKAAGVPPLREPTDRGKRKGSGGGSTRA